MKRLLFLLMAVLTVGVMAGFVNAQALPVLDRSVEASTDDAEEHTDAGENGRMEGITSTDLELGREDDWPDQQLCGMRFNNITIPNGATIVSAYLEFTIDEQDTGQMSLTVFGELSPDVPDTFTTAAYNLSSRPRTSAEVDWIDLPDWLSSMVGTKQQTPDISSIISEITGQAGWAAGNSLVLLVEALGAPNGSQGDRTAESWDGGGVAQSPLLHVEYMPNTAWDPTPEDNGWALVDLPLLEWEMPDPLVEGDTLSVNVYFGTDPNLIVGKNGTIQPVDGLAVVNTDAFGRPLTLNLNYYWRVDVIDPNGGSGTVIITGETWTFTTVVPPVVMVTETEGSTEVSEEGETSETFTISLSKSPDPGTTVTVAIAPMTGISVPIAASGDDAEEHQDDGAIGRSSTDLELGADGGDLQIIGLWFRNIQIPAGATITSATVELMADEDEDDPVYTTIWGRLDDPGSFQQDINWMISTPTIDDETTAQVEWTMVGTETFWVNEEVILTPDISSVIQEIINQPRWAGDGNDNLAICIGHTNSEGDTLPNDQRRATSWNQDSHAPGMGIPTLHVEFDTGTQITLSHSEVVFTDQNWTEDGVVVTVTAVDDDVSEPDPHTVLLETTVTSNEELPDVNWDGLPADDVLVYIVENDCGAWGFDPMDLNKDCFVDLGDLAVFAADFGKCTEPFELNCNNLSN